MLSTDDDGVERSTNSTVPGVYATPAFSGLFDRFTLKRQATGKGHLTL